MRFLLPLLIVLASSLPAAVLTVSTLDDSGPGSLRDAIEQANAIPNPNEIVFDESLEFPAVILLQSPLPDITEDLTITGPASRDLYIERDVAAGAFRILSVLANVSLRNLWIGKGRVEGGPDADGGAIHNLGVLSLRDCVVFDSFAIGETVSMGDGGHARGGAIFSSGDLTLIDTLVVNCAARGGNTDEAADNAGSAAGGGIYMAAGELVLLRSGVSECRARGGTNTSDAANSGTARGGGVVAIRAIIHDSGIYDCLSIGPNNTSEGGVLVLTGQSTIRRSSMHENQGAGVVTSGGLLVENSTISGNQGVWTGGVVVAGGAVAVRYSTIVHNSGMQSGGIEIITGTLSVEGSIIASNTGAVPDVSGVVSDGGFNLIGNAHGSTGFTASLLVGGPFNEIDPGLGPLQAFGGFSAGHVPVFGGFALDMGGPGAPFDDQRRANRALGGTPDIGAVEFIANQAPSFTAGERVSANSGGAVRVFPRWATNISPGAPWEAGQKLTFHVSGPRWPFISGPEIDPQTGDLSFQTHSHASGTFRFDVWLTDDGGTALGGQNRSGTQQLVIELQDPPGGRDDRFECSTSTGSGATMLAAVVAALALGFRRRGGAMLRASSAQHRLALQNLKPH